MANHVKFNLDEFISKIEALPIDQQLDAVDAQRAQLEMRIVLINDQLDAAKDSVAYDNEYSDPQWYRAATSAKRRLGWAVQRLQEYRGKLRKKINQIENTQQQKQYHAEHAMWLQAFFDVCKMNLSEVSMRGLIMAADMRSPRGTSCPMG